MKPNFISIAFDLKPPEDFVSAKENKMSTINSITMHNATKTYHTAQNIYSSVYCNTFILMLVGRNWWYIKTIDKPSIYLFDAQIIYLCLFVCVLKLQGQNFYIMINH